MNGVNLWLCAGCGNWVTDENVSFIWLPDDPRVQATVHDVTRATLDRDGYETPLRDLCGPLHPMVEDPMQYAATADDFHAMSEAEGYRDFYRNHDRSARAPLSGWVSA